MIESIVKVLRGIVKLRGATDNTLIGNVSDALKVTGDINTIPKDGNKITYSASNPNFVCAASATDIFTITGSATKTVRVTAIGVSGTTTAGSGFSVSCALIKRSTANSSGTSTTATNIPHNSNSSAATAVVKAYTANPTLGTSVGPNRSYRITINTAGLATSTPMTLWDFGNRPSQSLVLRGTSESLCINFNSTTITGPVISAWVEWTEE